jgi:putative transposase
MRVYRALVFHCAWPDRRVGWLLAEYRQATNKVIRYGLKSGVTSRFGLTKGTYFGLRAEHSIYSTYLQAATETATVVLKNYRRRIRKGLRTSLPFVRRLFLKADNQTFKLNRESGILRIPIRAGESCELRLPLSEYHKRFLSDSALELGSLTVLPDKVVITLRKERPIPILPRGVLALDTNEASVDGVLALPEQMSPVRATFEEVRRIQSTHFKRRRKIARKKAGDARIRGRLMGREGRRERSRVEYSLHRVANAVVTVARNTCSAVVLEELRRNEHRTRSKSLNRRLSSWPRHKLHRLIEYKAEWAGVPVFYVDPRNTSRRCPMCGWVAKSRTRAIVFRCQCGWKIDRQLNAGLNILKTALASNEVLARAVRFQPAALRRDVVNLFHPSNDGVRGAERTELVDLPVPKGGPRCHD